MKSLKQSASAVVVLAEENEPDVQSTPRIRTVKRSGIPFLVRGNGLFKGPERCVATTRGSDIFDSDNRRVATMRENELLDSDYRTILTLRGTDIHDAADTKIGTLEDALRSLHGEATDMLIVAFWFCFVR